MEHINYRKTPESRYMVSYAPTGGELIEAFFTDYHQACKFQRWVNEYSAGDSSFTDSSFTDLTYPSAAGGYVASPLTDRR